MWTIDASGSNTTGLEDNLVRDLVAEAQGVNPKRNQMQPTTYTPPATGTRRLQNHVYQWKGVLISDRSTAAPLT